MKFADLKLGVIYHTSNRAIRGPIAVVDVENRWYSERYGRAETRRLFHETGGKGKIAVVEVRTWGSTPEEIAERAARLPEVAAQVRAGLVHAAVRPGVPEGFYLTLVTSASITGTWEQHEADEAARREYWKLQNAEREQAARREDLARERVQAWLDQAPGYSTPGTWVELEQLLLAAAEKGSPTS